MVCGHWEWVSSLNLFGLFHCLWGKNPIVLIKAERRVEGVDMDQSRRLVCKGHGSCAPCARAGYGITPQLQFLMHTLNVTDKTYCVFFFML